MNEQMKFPETFEEFAKEYGFKDNKEVYTNGSDLIPIFRVKQWLEHVNKPELKPCPFCSTEVKMLKKALYGYPGCFDFEVRCPKCGCTVNYTHSDIIYRTEEEAVANVTKTWNERYVDWFERVKESEE